MEDLDEYTTFPNYIHSYQPSSQVPRSIPRQLVHGAVDFGITTYNAAIKGSIKTYHDAHDGILHRLADSRRGKMCRRAEIHDIALLPSSKPEVTERNQRLSPLLRLPLELRAQIYNYAHAPHAIITVSEDLRRNRYRLVAHVRLSGQHTPECNRRKSTRSCSSPNTVLALPITCYQMYTETIHYLYDNNTFRFTNNRLILSLPSTIPTNHLRIITSLCLTFDLDPLTTALRLPRIMEGDAGDSRAAKMHRKEYVDFWQFLATTLRNLQTLLVFFRRKNIGDSDLEPRICEWLLTPLFQFEEGESKSSWGPKLTLFDVRLDIWFPTSSTLIREYQTMGAPFFLGQWCDCALDCRRCIECNHSDDYCLRSTTGAWVVVCDD